MLTQGVRLLKSPTSLICLAVQSDTATLLNSRNDEVAGDNLMTVLTPTLDAQLNDCSARSDVDAPSLAIATVLLVEPQAGRGVSRSLFLQAAHYAVITVNTASELQALGASRFISIVIVSEDLKRSSLRQVTEFSRSKWPLARILVLGRAQRILEDNLYDESIEEPFMPKQLLDALAVLLIDPWNQRSPRAVQKGRQERETLPLPLAPPAFVPTESDPTKMIPQESVHQTPTWDTPAGERIGR